VELAKQEGIELPVTPAEFVKIMKELPKDRSINEVLRKRGWEESDESPATSDKFTSSLGPLSDLPYPK
jgi:hypothetical protein